MITNSGPTCTGITNLSPSSCVFTSNTLTLYSVVSSTKAAGTSFSFTVNDVLNPYNGKPLSGFTISTLDANGYSIESFTTATYTVTNPTSFSTL